MASTDDFRLLQTNASFIDHVLSKQRLQSRRPRGRKLSDSSSNIFVIIANIIRPYAFKTKTNVASPPQRRRRDDPASCVVEEYQCPYSPKVRNQVKNIDTLTL